MLWRACNWLSRDVDLSLMDFGNIFSNFFSAGFTGED